MSKTTTAIKVIRIAAAISIASSAGAGIMAAIDTTKRARDVIEECKQSLERRKADGEKNGEEKIPWRDKLEIVWDYVPRFTKAYWRTGAIVLVGTVSGVLANSVALGTIGGLLSAGGALGAKFSKYRKEVERTYGPKEERRIATKAGLSLPEIYGIIDSKDGEELFYDFDSGRYFVSSLETVKRRVSEFKKMLEEENMEEFAWDNCPVCPNEFYVGVLGLDPVPFFDDKAWYPGEPWECTVWEDEITELSGTRKVYCIHVTADMEWESNNYGGWMGTPNYQLKNINYLYQMDNRYASNKKDQEHIVWAI